MDALQCANANRKMACRLPSAFEGSQDDVTDKQERLSAPRSTEEHQMRRRPCQHALRCLLLRGKRERHSFSSSGAACNNDGRAILAGQFSPLELRNVVLDDIHEAGKRGFRAILLCGSDRFRCSAGERSRRRNEAMASRADWVARLGVPLSGRPPLFLAHRILRVVYIFHRHPKRKARAKRAKAVQESDGKPLLRNDSYTAFRNGCQCVQYATRNASVTHHRDTNSQKRDILPKSVTFGVTLAEKA